MSVADLNSAPPAGEAIATAAARLMRKSRRFFDLLAQLQPDQAADLNDMGQAVEAVAEELERGPFGSTIGIAGGSPPRGGPADETERRNCTAEVARMLLRDSTALFRNAARQNPQHRPELGLVASLFDGMANDLELAPGGVFGPELEHLRPYLEAARDLGPLPLPDMETTRRLLEDPRFSEIAHRVFEITIGQDLSRVAEQPRLVWARRLAAAWLLRRGPTPEPLSEEDRAAIAFALDHPRTGWCMPPMVAGPWSDATPADAAVLLGMISEVCRAGPAAVPLALACYCDRVRTRPLACHGGVLLVEAQGYTAGGQPGLIQAIIHDERIVVADSGSQVIHFLNDLVGPQLDTPEARRDYFMLFLNWVRDDGGSRFHAIESIEALVERLAGDTAAADPLKDALTPILEISTEDPTEWTLDARICVQSALCDCVFTLTEGGELTMIDENIIAEGLPVRREIQDGFLVRFAEAATIEGEVQ